MGNGNNDVGYAMTREPGDPTSLARDSGPSERRINGQNPLGTEWPRVCGAMSLQGGDSGRGNESVPQKFVRLVGCRDSKAKPEPWERPRAAPAKR